jgi:hypothetical protein
LTVGSAEPKAKLGAGLIGQKESTFRPILLTAMELSVPDCFLKPAKISWLKQKYKSPEECLTKLF